MWQHPPPIKSGADVVVALNLLKGSANGRELLSNSATRSSRSLLEPMP
jgi:hypothetical protein